MKTMTKDIAGTCVCSMCIELSLRHNVKFYRFRTFKCGQSTTHQNGSMDANRSIDDNENACFENALVWTGQALFYLCKLVNSGRCQYYRSVFIEEVNREELVKLGQIEKGKSHNEF